MPRSKLFRSLSLPKFPSISRATLSRAFLPSHLKCVFEDNRPSVNEAEKVGNVDPVTMDSGRHGPRHSSRRSRLSADAALAKEKCSALANVQASGRLWLKVEKKRRMEKWKKRYFVLKDSFLFYYNSKEKNLFEQKRKLNLRPLGMIPLGGLTQIDPCQIHGKQHGISIKYDDLETPAVICCSSEQEQDSWIKKLRDASRITVNSTQLGDVIIRELETQGLRLHEERQRYIERLQSEATALRNEIDRNDELERLKTELELEKTKLEQTTHDLRLELNDIKLELEDTAKTKHLLESEKQQLCSKTETLQMILEELAQEKEKIKSALTKQETEKAKLSKENQQLSAATENLRRELKKIEKRTTLLQKEKAFVEMQLQENLAKSEVLEEEKEYYSLHAKELMASLNDLAAQKEMTEAELKDEIYARVAAEKQLRAAEQALEHLELALKLSGPGISAELKDQIMPDVRKLKDFFEDCVEEARLDANRPLIMKNAVYARKSFLKKCKQKFRNSFRRATSLNSCHLTKAQQNGNVIQPTRLLICNIGQGPSLFDAIMSGHQPSEWIKVAAAIGQFLAKFRHRAKRDMLPDSSRLNCFSTMPPLYDWLRSLNTRDAFLRLLPQYGNDHDASGIDGVDDMNNNVFDEVSMLYPRAFRAKDTLKDRSTICFQSMISKHIGMDWARIRLCPETSLAFGPESLDAATFLADICLMHYMQTDGNAHKTVSATAAMAREFCSSYNLELDRQETPEFGLSGKRRLWSDIAVLTGWEIVRRAVTEYPTGNPAVEAGLRLLIHGPQKLPEDLVAVAFRNSFGNTGV